jgi:hypothetical protein
MPGGALPESGSSRLRSYLSPRREPPNVMGNGARERGRPRRLILAADACLMQPDLVGPMLGGRSDTWLHVAAAIVAGRGPVSARSRYSETL